MEVQTPKQIDTEKLHQQQHTVHKKIWPELSAIILWPEVLA